MIQRGKRRRSAKSLERPVTVYDVTGLHTGQTTGAMFKCKKAGCTGSRLSVLWEDGRKTYPCTTDMIKTDYGWQLLGRRSGSATRK